MPEGGLQLLRGKQIVLHEKLTDLGLPDLLMAKHPFHLLRAKKTKTNSGFTKTDSAPERAKDRGNILLLHPAEFTADFSKSWPAATLPGQGLDDFMPATVA